MARQAKKQKQTVSGIPNPHDSAFKSALSDVRVAREFFETYLPASIRAMVDLSDLRIQGASFVDEELTISASDILYETTFSLDEKETGYLYLLAEHQSTPDYWLPLRILGYVCRILDRHRQQNPAEKRLPLVVPLIFFTGTGEYTKSTDLFELFGEHADLAKKLLFGPYTLRSVQHTEDDEILKHRWVGLMEMLLKHIYIRDTATLLTEVSNAFLDSLLVEDGTETYVNGMLNYTLNFGNVMNVGVFIETVRKKVSVKVGEKIMSIAQQFEQQGVHRGRQEGRQEGMYDGLRKAREAQQLFHAGTPLKSIAKITGVSEEALRELLN